MHGCVESRVITGKHGERPASEQGESPGSSQEYGLDSRETRRPESWLLEGSGTQNWLLERLWHLEVGSDTSLHVVCQRHWRAEDPRISGYSVGLRPVSGEIPSVSLCV